jgi:hypothetical protein
MDAARERFFEICYKGVIKRIKKGSGESLEPLLSLERKTGFEPATPTLARREGNESPYILVYLNIIFMSIYKCLCFFI